jgi:hypothetical protein
MATTRGKITFSVWENWGQYLDAVRKINASKGMSDLSQVVLEGITAMQRYQRQYAPVGETGEGPHGRIPRSIKPARVIKRNNAASATSRTDYGPAIFTNEGTGSRQSDGGGRPYFIPRGSTGFWHPGIRGSHWWERGADRGSLIALEAFRRKVERTLNVKGAVRLGH